jgi:hypothetical protein
MLPEPMTVIFMMGPPGVWDAMPFASMNAL